MTSILTGNVKKEMFRLTLPSVGGMLAIMIFNVTDTYFVSKLGTDQLAAMGFTFAVVMMVGALTMGFSTGATSIVSRAIGSGNKHKASRTVTDGLFLTIIVAGVISLTGYFNIIPLFTLLGASGKVLSLVQDYMQIWFIGAIVAILPPLSDDCLRASGDMIRPLFVMLICAGVNLILDPLLIFGYGPIPAMGIKGAALATILARVLGMSASLYFLNSHAKLIEWKIPSLSDLIKSWKEIIRLGIPAAVTQCLNPVAQAFYIKMAVTAGGVSAVAAIAAGTRVENFASIFAMAYGIAIIPFVGQNFGAGNHDRVNKVRSMSAGLSVCYSIVTFIVFYFVAGMVASIFTTDPLVSKLCSRYLVMACVGHAGLYLSVFISQMLNATGHPRPVLLLTLFRVFIYIMPCVYFGSTYYGFTGLVAGLVIGNLLSGIHAYILGVFIFKKRVQKKQELKCVNQNQ